MFRPGFDLDPGREKRAAAGQPESFGEDDLYPDVRPTLSTLHESGYWVGIAGNQTVRAGGILRSLDLPSDMIATSDDWGVSKPDPAFFEAAHCATAPDQLYDGEIGTSGFDSLNTVYQENWDKDIMLINARGYYRMFDGSPTTSTYKLVHGWGYHAAGEYLCQSGATSGTVCGLKTTNVSNGSYQLTDSDGDTFYVHGMITATQVDGATAARRGDSGGPVFSLMGSGVRAKGVVSGTGGSTLIFQDWADVISSFNAYPVTAP